MEFVRNSTLNGKSQTDLKRLLSQRPSSAPGKIHAYREYPTETGQQWKLRQTFQSTTNHPNLADSKLPPFHRYHLPSDWNSTASGVRSVEARLFRNIRHDLKGINEEKQWLNVVGERDLEHKPLTEYYSHRKRSKKDDGGEETGKEAIIDEDHVSPSRHAAAVVMNRDRPKTASQSHGHHHHHLNKAPDPTMTVSPTIKASASPIGNEHRYNCESTEDLQFLDPRKIKFLYQFSKYRHEKKLFQAVTHANKYNTELAYQRVSTNFQYPPVCEAKKSANQKNAASVDLRVDGHKLAVGGSHQDASSHQHLSHCTGCHRKLCRHCGHRVPV